MLDRCHTNLFLWRRRETKSVQKSLQMLLLLIWMNCVHAVRFPDSSSDDCLKSTDLSLSFPIDPARKPTCASKVSIQRLNLHLRRRYIHVITSPFRNDRNTAAAATTTESGAVQQMVNNVQCYQETQIVPSNVTLAAIHQYLQRKFGTKAYQSVQNKNIQTSGEKKNTVGRYLQHLVKLGVARR